LGTDVHNDRRGRIRGRLIRTVIAGLIGVSLAAGMPAGAAPTSPSNGDNKATFGIGPANTKGFDGRSVLNYDASPGSRLADRIAVRNYSADTLNLLVYAADAANGDNGAISYLPRANPGTDAGRWFRFVDNSTAINLTLRPRQIVVLPIQVTIPGNATPGDHVAGVLASLSSKVIGKSGQQVTLDQRVALRALFRISGTIVPALTIEHPKAKYRNNWNPFGSGSATVSYTVHNTGNVILGGPQTVKVSGLFGSTGSHAAIANVPLLLPGGSVRVSVRVHGVSPEFIMDAKINVATTGAPSAVNPGIHATKATASFWAIPWMLLLLIALLLGGVIYWIVRGRRGPRRIYRGERRFEPTPMTVGAP
jgi:hypothetical protein